MALTLDQLAEVRIWLPWDPPSDSDLQARHDALDSDSIYPLIVEQLRKQLTLLIVTPAQFTIVGDYGQNTGENMKRIRELMAEAEALALAEVTAESGGVQTAQLVRPDPYRAGRSAPRSSSSQLVPGTIW